MKNRKKYKLVIDILMLILLVILMGARMTGKIMHIVFGSGFLILFFLHNLANISWWRNLNKGKQTGRRLKCTVLNGLLTLDMLLVTMSGVIYVQKGHRLSAVFLLILIFLHIGMHKSFPK